MISNLDHIRLNRNTPNRVRNTTIHKHNHQISRRCLTYCTTGHRGQLKMHKTQQRHRQWHLIRAHITPLSNCKDTGDEHSSLHSSKHTKHIQATRVQNITLYSDGTTHITQHRSKGIQPNGSLCANNYCSTRYEHSFRHNKHTYQQAYTDQYLRHNRQVHRKLHHGNHSIHNIYKLHILTSSFKTGVPQGGVLSPTLLNIYTADIPSPSAWVQVWRTQMTSPSHLHTQARVQP